MIKKIDKFISARKESEETHDWVVFSNPRNGKIKITGCLSCGSVLHEGANDSICTGEKDTHPILSKGWKTNKQTPQSTDTLLAG